MREVGQFFAFRDVIAGSSSSKGIKECLTLLNITQTCEYQEIDFLDFLRSGEKGVDAFVWVRRRCP